MKCSRGVGIAVGLAVLVLATGCGKSLKDTLQQAEGSATEERRAERQAEKDATLDYLDEWDDFRAAAEAQIAANVKRIDELTSQAVNDEKLRATLNTSMEKLVAKNQELKNQLGQYKDEGKLGWDAFKRDYSHELTALSRNLKELGSASH